MVNRNDNMLPYKVSCIEVIKIPKRKLMFNWVKHCGLLAAALCISASAQAGVLSFEDQYPGGPWFGDLAPGYGGFDWGNAPAVVANDYIASRGYELGTVGSTGLIALGGI